MNIATRLRMINPKAAAGPVPGAALWLDGADASTLFTDAGLTPVKNDGDLVYQWNDKSGNSRHATQTTSGNRPTWVPPASGRNGLGALAFNGSQNFAVNSIGNMLTFGTGDFTAEAWINLLSQNANDTKVICCGTSQHTFYWRVGIGYLANVNGLQIARLGVADCEYCAFTFTPGVWYHVAVTRSRYVIRFFINGQLQTTQGSGASDFSYQSSTNASIGSNNENLERFKGSIQNLLIYNGQALYTSNFTPR